MNAVDGEAPLNGAAAPLAFGRPHPPSAEKQAAELACRCDGFRARLLAWREDVFYIRAPADPNREREFRGEAELLAKAAAEFLAAQRGRSLNRWTLDAAAAVAAAAFKIDNELESWCDARAAISPAARGGRIPPAPISDRCVRSENAGAVASFEHGVESPA